MAIAYLITEYPSRSHTFIRREIAAMRSAGVAIEVFAIRRAPRESLLTEREVADYDETWPILPAPLVPVLRAHAGALLRSPRRYGRVLSLALRNRNPGLRSALWALFQFVEAVYLGDELRRRGTDHLHVHFATSAAQIGRLVHELLDLPWSMTLHGSCDFEYPAGPLLGAKLDSVAFTSCVSWFGRAQALGLVAPEQWDRIFVSRCGIELDRLHQRRPAPAGRPYRITFVGRVSREKGVHGLLHVLAGVRAAGVDAELHFVGDGPGLGELRAAIDRMGLAPHCTFYGAVSEDAVLEHLATTDLLVMSSFMEGIPMVLMEAMGSGVPVVAPRVAGIPELVDHERSGLLYHPGNWEDMTAAVVRMATEPGLAESLVGPARETVEREFDITVAVQPLAARFLAAKGDHG